MRSRVRFTENAGEQVDWTELSLMAGAKDTHQDSLMVGSPSCSVAGARLAIDHGRTNRLLGGPVGRLHLRPFQKDKQLILMTPQMLGQALIGPVGLLLGQQASHASLQMPLGDPYAARTDLPGIPAVSDRQGRLQKGLHLGRKLD